MQDKIDMHLNAVSASENTLDQIPKSRLSNQKQYHMNIGKIEASY